MSAQTVPETAVHRLVMRFAASRFLTISILLHAIFILMVGGTVLYRVTAEPPDFEAGSDGILVEDGNRAEPPAAPAVNQPAEQQFTPSAPMVSAPLSALLTLSQQAPTWTVAAVPNAPVQGVSDTLKSAIASVGNKLEGGGSMGGGMMGRIGGTRTAMIFGKKIEAARLGVILDVSGSAHPHLAGAITEIQKGFADAVLILYPGCGLTDFDGKSDHDIRKYSTIPKKEFDAGATNFTTPAQLVKALKIEEFEKMTKRPSVKDTLHVSWYAERGDDGKPTGTAPKLIGRTQVAFEDLLKRGVDTIYWFADFQDAVDPRVADRLTAQLKNKRVKLHVHNFAGSKINTEVTAMAEKTGGTVNTEKPK
jgi:hypothetical protein